MAEIFKVLNNFFELTNYPELPTCVDICTDSQKATVGETAGTLI